MKRFCYWFLFAIFVVAIVLGAIRPLRVSPLYQVIGVFQFAAMALAAWILGARAITRASREPRLLALAGIFLITPFALLALLWVGLGPPWVGATPPENQMRYLVLSPPCRSRLSLDSWCSEKRSAKRMKTALASRQSWLAGPLLT